MTRSQMNQITDLIAGFGFANMAVTERNPAFWVLGAFFLTCWAVAYYKDKTR